MAQLSAHSRDSMRKAGDALQKAEDDLRRTRAQLDGDQKALASRWQGEGSQAFVNVFQRFDSQFVKVITDLNMIQQKLGDARVKYDATEAETAARVNQLKSMIND